MKTPPYPLLRALALLSVTAGLSTTGLAQSSLTSANTPRQSLRIEAPDITDGVKVASVYLEDHTLGHYLGQKLLNTENAELGTIKDFIVHPASNRVRYVVVSSGGILGAGDSLRLVPISSLRRNDDNRLAVNISQANWLQVPPVISQEYKEDRLNVTAAQDQQLRAFFGPGSSRAGESDLTSYRTTTGEIVGLIRASEFRNKSVRGAGQHLGEIETLVVDLENGGVAALIDARREFTGTKAKYLVPLNRLIYTFPRQNPLESSLTRTDFDGAQPTNYGMQAGAAAAVTSNSRPTITSTASTPLTPTGRTPEPTGYTATSTVATSTDTPVQAVRDAFRADPTLAVERIDVTPENGRIVLRGTVRDQATKENLERAARRAVPTMPIEIDLIVESR